MNEYFFLFGLAGVWMFFAAIHDFRTREVPNWLNFSLIAIALAYRAYYALFNFDSWFFLSGVIGLLIFVVLAFALYYGRAFGGGDAKLLMGVGVILPFSAIEDFFIGSFSFILILFGVGAAYSFVYSLFLIKGKKKEISKEFNRLSKGIRRFTIGAFLVGIILAGIAFYNVNGYVSFSLLVLGLSPAIYVYAKIVDKVCMVKTLDSRRLREGDWLFEDVRIKGKTIKKSVHGLTKEEIELLRRNKKKVTIRDGIPFTVNFLLATMVFFWLFFFSGFGVFGLF